MVLLPGLLVLLGAALAAAQAIPPQQPGPTAVLQGRFEFVYAYWRDHCDKLPPSFYCSRGGGMGGMCPHPPCRQDRMSGGCNIDIADSPSYAFRNASGATTIMASMNRGSRAMIGPSLLEAKHVCVFYANSSNLPQEELFASHEWIKGVFPFNHNNTVYALNDMEFHQPYRATLPNGTNVSGEFKFVSITLAKSTDGGATFGHAAAPPNHVIATMQLAWNTSVPYYGYRMPSNILAGKRPEHDGWFYATFNTGVHDPRFQPPTGKGGCEHSTRDNCGSRYEKGGPYDGYADVVGGQQLGTCIMRTRDLTNASSWRAWGGGDANDFTVDLSTNPYPAGAQPMRSCATLAKPVLNNRTAASYLNHVTILWSTFYGRYVSSQCLIIHFDDTVLLLMTV